MKNLVKLYQKLTFELHKNHINEYTASCAYYTILSFIPFVLLILTLTKYVGLEEQSLFLVFKELVPSNILNNAVIDIIREVYSKSLGTITISFLFTLWSAEKGFLALCKGLNAVYEVKENNRFIMYRLRALLCTIVFIILVVLSLILLVFGNSINQILQEKFNLFNGFIVFLLNSKVFISILLLTFLFTIMYRFIPKHGYPFKKQLPGAIIAAVACNLISSFYAIYIDIFTGFSIMYGSLTTVVLAMMWVYGCMYSILLGASMNQMLIKK